MSMTLALTASQTSAAKSAFSSRYYVSNTGDSNFTSQFSVSWDDFAYYVQDIMNNTDGATEENFVLQFFHRYDAENQAWFLTMGGGVMSSVSVRKIDGNDVYNVTEGTLRYDMSANGIALSDFTGEYASDYFNHFYYRPYDTTYLPLSSDTSHSIYVSAISIIWYKEIYQLYQDNLSTSTKVNLVFASVSFDYPQPSPYFNVEWPHTICLFMNIDNTDQLGNTTYPALFKMKAADFGSGCPPAMCQYIMPTELTSVQGENPEE